MENQEVTFGSFSTDETSNLFIHEDTGDLQFVWQSSNRVHCNLGTPHTPPHSSLLDIPSSVPIDVPIDVDSTHRRSFSPELHSPNIPPNPPTTPVDHMTEEEGSHGPRRPSSQGAMRKLNVNALPFVPGGMTRVEKNHASRDADDVSSINSKNTAINSNNVAINSNSGTVVPAPNSTSADTTKSSGNVGVAGNGTARQLDFGGKTSNIIGGGGGGGGDDLEEIVALKNADAAVISEEEDGGEMPWPNLVSVQTSGQVTAASWTASVNRTTDETLEAEPVIQPISMSSPLNERSVAGSCIDDVISPPTSTLSPPTSVATEGGDSREAAVMSPYPLSISPPPTITHSDTNTAVDLNSDPLNSDPFPPLADQVRQDDSKYRTSEPHVTPTSQATPTSLHTTTSTCTIDQTRPDNASSEATPTPGLCMSSTGSAHGQCNSLIGNTVRLPGSPPTTAPTVGGAWKTPKSWASIVSRPADVQSASQDNTMRSLSGSHTHLPSAPARTSSGTKQAGETRGEGVKPNGVGSNGGGVAPVKRKDLEESRKGDGWSQFRVLGEQLQKLCLSHKRKAILPRGLTNNGNWCYMHAPLQALLSIPAIQNLFRAFDPNPPLTKGPSTTPFLDAMIQFVHEFKDYPRGSMAPPPSTNSRKKRPHMTELLSGDSLRPEYIYAMLHRIRSNLSYKGRQEDAEEFLGCMLDGLHEELVSAKKAVQDPNTEDKGSGVSDDEVSTPSSPEGEGPRQVCVGEEAGQEWEQVGPKNKSTITRQTSFSESPITEIFGGKLRSCLHRQGAKESATMEPFFSLQLDIQSNTITSVKEALDVLVAKETVHISEVDAYKRLSLARLPPVLIFHLKRFIFNSSGSQKVFKHIHYTTEMELSKDLLAPAIKTKLTPAQRTYRLWAVVYHHGKTATGGHYTSDVYHTGYGGWIRMDDSILKPIPDDFVLTPGSGVTNKNAYLLFYRRVDTVGD